ncbi:MAG: hypothetical protein WHV67_07700 [Thermoanaerobaculia bacterium]
MITGFNTDVEYNKKTYHVQTEDKGFDNPYIESLIYVGGAIIFSKRTSYAEKIAVGISEKEIRALMENQHKTIIAAIKRGRFEALLPGKDKKEVKAPVEKEEKPSKASLDEMIQQFVKQQEQKDIVEINLLEDIDFYAGGSYNFMIKTESSLSKVRIANVKITAKLISTMGPPVDLFKGYTNTEGKCKVSFSIPSFKHGNAAIIIIGESKEFGTGEYKILVKKKL